MSWKASTRGQLDDLPRQRCLPRIAAAPSPVGAVDSGHARPPRVPRRLGRAHPDPRRRRAVGQHLDPGAGAPSRPDERFPAVLEMIPYGKDNWRRNSDIARGRVAGRAGLRPLPGRRPGHRQQRRASPSTSTPRTRRRTATRPSNGWRPSPGAPAPSAMWGISYGGFTSIQVAALRPPHLRAIVPIMATDDRYRDDVHYRGGCLTVSEQSQYAVSQVAMNAMPPDPSFRGAAWREEWLARLRGDAAVDPGVAPPADRRARTTGRARSPRTTGGSRCRSSQYTGWHDSYVDPAFRMQERCTASPERLLVSGSVGPRPARQRRAGPDPRLAARDARVLRPPPARHRRAGPDALPGRPLVPPAVVAAGGVPGGVSTGSGWAPTPTRSRAWSPSRGGSPGVPARWSAGSSRTSVTPRRTPERRRRAGTDAVRHRPTLGTAGTLSWGAGGAPNGLAPRPPPRRGAEPDLHVRAARRAARRARLRRRRSSTSRPTRRSPRSSSASPTSRRTDAPPR